MFFLYKWYMCLDNILDICMLFVYKKDNYRCGLGDIEYEIFCNIMRMNIYYVWFLFRFII